MSPGVVCAYSLSGGYGPIPRFLYYVLLIVTLVFHKTKWLVDSTLGASMIFSSIAAVHAVALASARGRGTVDLDIIPVYSITGMGMVIVVPLLVWSKTLREAERSARLLVFLWIGLMFIGSMASLASVKKLPMPLQCDDFDTPGCPPTCDVALPMRQGQQINLIPLHATHFLVDTWSGLFSWCGTTLTLMGLLFAEGRQRPVDLARAQLKSNTGSRRFRRKNADRVATCAICTPPLSVAMIIAHVIIMEVMMLGPRGIPLGENMTAIGQWGPLVGATFAMIASIIQWNVAAPIAEKDVEQISRTVNCSTLPETTEIGLESAQNSPTSLFDTGAYFQEGRWWGRGADALPVMEHGGVKWVVREGYLRRFDNETIENIAVPRYREERCRYPLV